MDERYDIAVVGAGAAGLAAAIFAAETLRAHGSLARVVALDGAARIGAKILISGGGRCNVSHDVVRPEDFNGSRHLVRHILARFDAGAAVRWFATLGVPLKREDTGKLFPTADRARTVLDALLTRCNALDVLVLTGRRVHDIRQASGPAGCREFILRHERGQSSARRVIMATGGRSVPRTGSDGVGWAIVRRLGHQVTPTYPALVALILDSTGFDADMAGVSHAAELSVFVDGKLADRRMGPLLWTHFGVSGPVVMDASRHWTVARGAGRQAEVRCNFVPGSTFDRAERLLLDRIATHPRRLVPSVLGDELPERLAIALVRHAGVEPRTPLSRLTREARRALCHALTDLTLPVLRDRGWNYAEVTAGGVPLEEVDFRTMQSRIVPKLYLTGEMLDCDGRIGGFNFQWAWATGYLAGRAAAASLLE